MSNHSSAFPTHRARAGLLGICLVALLAACGGGNETAAPTTAQAVLDQAQICEVTAYGPATQCKPGQKVVFLPQTFGNEQLPILFAAINCDLRYTVALTKGGVVCIYTPMTLQSKEEAAAAPASGASAQP